MARPTCLILARWPRILSNPLNDFAPLLRAYGDTVERPIVKITHIETIPVRVPIRQQVAITSSLGSHADSPFLMLRVHTDEGLVGLGEVSCTPKWSGEDSRTAQRLIQQYLEPALVGQDPRNIEAAVKTMGRALASNPFTKSGVEIALWDILGKASGLPLYRLLGGAVREVVALKFSISGASPAKAAELAGWALRWAGRIWNAWRPFARRSATECAWV
jgi:L-alanine-DL-glutamate epimerase-like enolase superfamily enzyme